MHAFVLVAALVLVTSLSGAGSAAAGADTTLSFERDGAVVKTLDRAALEGACAPTTVALDDPYYGRQKRYRACPLATMEGPATLAGPSLLRPDVRPPGADLAGSPRSSHRPKPGPQRALRSRVTRPNCHFSRRLNSLTNLVDWEAIESCRFWALAVWESSFEPRTRRCDGRSH